MGTQSDRLEFLITANWKNALKGDTKSIDAVSRLTKRLRKLYGLEAAVDTEWTDLGDDHACKFYSYKDPDGVVWERVGVLVRHETPSGKDCMGSVIFEGAPSTIKGARWSVESYDPLTVSPSLLCSCGDHGFIRDGRWVRV